MTLLLVMALAAETWTPELQMQVRAVGPVAVSADGKRSAWVEAVAGKHTLWVDGMQVALKTGGVARLDFAPDGTVYFEFARAYYRLRAGPEPEKVSRSATAEGRYSLSASGVEYAFVARREASAKGRVREVGVVPYRHQICMAKVDSAVEPRCTGDVPGYVGLLALSADASYAAFESRVTPFPNDGRTSDIYEANLATGEVTAIAKTNATESQPFYSPDGKYIAYLRSDDPPLQPGDERIVLYDRAKKTARELPATYDRLPRLLGWSADSRSIYFQEDRGTRNALYAMPLDGPPQTVYAPNGVVGHVQLNGAGTHFGLTMEGSDQPQEAYALAAGAGQDSRHPISVWTFTASAGTR